MAEVRNEELVRQQACPMSASVHWNPKEDTDQDNKNWLEIYNKLPYQVKFGLVAETTENKIIEIAKQFDFYRAEEIGEIARIIRDSFVEGFFNETKIKKQIIERIKLDEKETEKLIVELFKLRKKIINVENEGVDIKIEKSPLMEVLKKFPEIGEQTIGENKIKISGEDEFRKQSIENWLDDYTIEKGSQAHNNLERSDYVFNSKNVNKLTFLEKKELLLILESYDENTDLEVDVNRKLILFDTAEGNVSEKLRESMRRDEKEVINDKINILSKEVKSTETTNKNIEKKENKEEEIIENGDKIQSKHIINLKDV